MGNDYLYASTVYITAKDIDAWKIYYLKIKLLVFYYCKLYYALFLLQIIIQIIHMTIGI